MNDLERRRAESLRRSKAHIEARKALGLARFHVWIPDTKEARETIKRRAAAMVKRYQQEHKDA